MSSDPARPLPARPDLEFERKQAKKLLARLRRGDPESLARARSANRSLADTPPDTLKLADAQLTIAREYGFRSWPLMVEYFTTLARHQRSPLLGTQHHGDTGEWWAETMVAEHRDRRDWAALYFATFVPRFYGMSVDEVFDSAVTIEDARLVVARQHGSASWEEFVAKVTASRHDPWVDPLAVLKEAGRAIRADDLEGLQKIVQQHPELITMEVPLLPGSNALAADVLHNQAQKRSAESRAITHWVHSLGIDLQATLNLKLLGRRMTAQQVTEYLAAGADPNWIAPNGIPLLEYAIHLYWNGDAVDVIAARVKPREALWIAAGLGDVRAMSRYFDRSGKLKPAARQRRPDFTAMDSRASPSLPEPDDLDLLWEVFYVAATNNRFAAMDFLLAHGFPIDYGRGMTMLSFAVGNVMLPLAEFLISRGANPEIRGWRPAQTAREMAEGNFKRDPSSTEARRMLEICGGRDPDVLISEAEANRKEVAPHPRLIKVHGLAKQDAARRGQTTVGLENLFIGMLRDPNDALTGALLAGGVDLDRLRTTLHDRLDPPPAESETIALPNDGALNEAIAAAVADAKARRESKILPMDLLREMTASGTGPVADIIRAAGGQPEGVYQQAARYGRPVEALKRKKA
jgi:hypothetical protein